MTPDHLSVLRLSLSHERARMAAAKTDAERAHRAVWVAQIEREIAGEERFLGVGVDPGPTLSDDDLLAALGAP